MSKRDRDDDALAVVALNEEAHESIARLASVDLGNPLEKIVARASAKRHRLAEFLSVCFGMSLGDAEIALLAFEEKEDQEYLAR